MKENLTMAYFLLNYLIYKTHNDHLSLKQSIVETHPKHQSI